MIIMNLRKKNSRQRGSKTHGWGSMKKHRGAGNRGGRGAAGSGKKGDAKKPSIWKNPKYWGKRGFKSKTNNKEAHITIAHLENYKKTLTQKGIITTKGDTIIADLEKAGYTKLLGTGNPTQKWEIIVRKATNKAKEKITKAKGKIITLEENNKEKTKEEN